MRILTVTIMLDARRGGGMAERSCQLARACAEVGGPTVTSEVLALDLDLTMAVAGRLEPATASILPCSNRRFYLPTKPQLVAERVREADVVHLVGHWTLLNALAYRAAVRYRVPHVHSPCGALPARGRSQLLKYGYDRAVGRSVLRRAAAVVAVTGAERDDLVRVGADPDSVEVIPNGVREVDHASMADGGFARRMRVAETPYVLFLGRLNKIKGPDLLVGAFAAAAPPGWSLVLAGPDEGMRAELERQAASAGVGERVRFAGVVSGAERTEALRRAALVVVPSRHEAMSIVALEAGINGTAVLLTDVCGFGEVERAGGGRVVAASEEALAVELRDLLADPFGLERMGRALQALVQAEYTWSRAAHRLMAVFGNAVAADRPGNATRH